MHENAHEKAPVFPKNGTKRAFLNCLLTKQPDTPRLHIQFVPCPGRRLTELRSYPQLRVPRGIIPLGRGLGTESPTLSAAPSDICCCRTEPYKYKKHCKSRPARYVQPACSLSLFCSNPILRFAKGIIPFAGVWGEQPQRPLMFPWQNPGHHSSKASPRTEEMTSHEKPRRARACEALARASRAGRSSYL